MDTVTHVNFVLDYLTPIFGVCPAIGDPDQADYCAGLAFGRNSYTDAELGKKLLDLGAGQLADPQVFHALERARFDPGRVNYQMANYAWRRFHRRGLPFVGQWEINYAMWEMNRQAYEGNPDRLHAVWAPPNTAYYPTPDVVRDILIRADQHGYKLPVLLAHDAHRARVVAVFWKQNRHVVTTSTVVDAWDPRSVQPATRRFVGLNPLTCWVPRELVARYAHHPLKGLVRLSPPKP